MHADVLPPPKTWFRRAADTLEFVKFSHTVFALPFALISMMVAAHGVPELRVVLLILFCMVTARTAAMAFNRWADWSFDIANPRTAGRFRLASKPTALALWVTCLLLFIGATALLNPLTLILSPVACALILGYSLTKRFTAYSHAFLGLALSAAPMGAWAATRGELLSPEPWCLAAAVLCWVFGFDLVYAAQDVTYDREVGLHSFPARYGVPAALRLARCLHVGAWLILLLFGLLSHQGMPYWIVLAGVAGALIYEHHLCAAGDLSKINIAFFQLNALVSLMLLAGVMAGLWIRF